MTILEFQDAVEAVCKRPAMYTPHGSFFEAVSFLEGVGVGVVREKELYHSVFTPFFNWLFDESQRKTQEVSWIAYRKRFATDSEALGNLSSSYHEFLKQRQVKS